jgi:protein O-GlcNAc transferase
MPDPILDPAALDAICDAAVAHHVAGRVKEAAVLYKQVVAIDPNHAAALHHLGVIAHAAGHHADAGRIISRVLALRPDWAHAHVNLGLVLHATGRHEAAIDSYRRAIELSPKMAQAHNNLGNALQAVGRLDEAIESYRRALEGDPKYAPAYGNLGNTLREAGRHAEAVEAHARAVALRPRDAKSHFNYGLSLSALGRWAEAAAAHRRATSLDPKVGDPAAFAAAMTEGQERAAAGRPVDAAAAYRRAAGMRPDSPAVWHNLAVVLLDAGDPDSAIGAAERGLALSPDDVGTLSNRGGALKWTGRIAESIASYRRAVEVDPTNVRAHNNLAYGVPFDPAASAADVLAAARRAAALYGPAPRRPQRRPIAGRPLRVGYVSPDFRDHVVGRNVLPLLRAHDRSAVEVYCYASVTKPDRFTEQWRAVPDVWREIDKLDDDAAAAMVRADRIDVLVDLTLHMAGNRLGLFARRPAPVQVTFAGYPGTTGLDAIDYRLTDPYLDPPGADGDYAERSVRLPHSFWCYDPVAMDVVDTPDPGPPPAASKGFVTFGCLNNHCKVNAEVLAAWARVLAAVPGSKMGLLAQPGSCRDRVRAALGADRVMFVPFQSRPDYLNMYRGIDLALDTFPYNGHTTSLDGLWMGVPTVTFVGRTVVGRAGWSQLSNLGLTELAAADVDGFIDTAVRLAADLPRLTTIRTGLRERMRRSPLTDTAGFARGVESAYRDMMTRAD